MSLYEHILDNQFAQKYEDLILAAQPLQKRYRHDYPLPEISNYNSKLETKIFVYTYFMYTCHIEPVLNLGVPVPTRGCQSFVGGYETFFNLRGLI